MFQAQFIAQSIGQAFQVAYVEFLKANGIEDHSFVKEMDYQEVLNSQEIFGNELAMFARKELQKEVCKFSAIQATTSFATFTTFYPVGIKQRYKSSKKYLAAELS